MTGYMDYESPFPPHKEKSLVNHKYDMKRCTIYTKKVKFEHTKTIMR